ncbi:MAG TPA: hypothetical protein VHC91_10615 [Trinickia sp.]|uniref:hypothetical protein n=1 Tax=Trinickia sp. TaxID=2571163 RepID=UPI002C8A8920|nr:hypothetical protein [Trinickia sp.]HVW50830.1 hypothetical protein [Trinickia sp.]
MSSGRKLDAALDEFLQPRPLRSKWRLFEVTPEQAVRIENRKPGAGGAELCYAEAMRLIFADLWGAPHSRIARQKWLVDKPQREWDRIVQALEWVDMWLRRSRALPPRLLDELLAAHEKPERAKLTSRLERELMAFHASVERHFRNVRVINAVLQARAEGFPLSTPKGRYTVLTVSTAFERAVEIIAGWDGKKYRFQEFVMTPSAIKKIFDAENRKPDANH